MVPRKSHCALREVGSSILERLQDASEKSYLVGHEVSSSFPADMGGNEQMIHIDLVTEVVVHTFGACHRP